MLRDLDVSGAEIRLRFRCRSDERDAATRAAEELRAKWLAAGAVAVKLEAEVVAEARARAPEIAAATTLAQKLAAFWRARGIDVDEARAERLIERARVIEEEARDAA